MSMTRIGQVALTVAALGLGSVTATALARQGADDRTATGTTGTTRTTPRPGLTKLGHGRIRVVGTVTAREEAAGTFTLSTRRRVPAAAARRAATRPAQTTFTVHAERIPAVGSFVLVKGRRLADGTIEAERVKVLRGCRVADDDQATASRRGADDACDDHQGRGRGSDGADDGPVGGDDGAGGRGRDEEARGHGRGRDDAGRGRGHGGDDA